MTIEPELIAAEMEIVAHLTSLGLAEQITRRSPGFIPSTRASWLDVTVVDMQSQATGFLSDDVVIETTIVSMARNPRSDVATDTSRLGAAWAVDAIRAMPGVVNDLMGKVDTVTKDSQVEISDGTPVVLTQAVIRSEVNWQPCAGQIVGFATALEALGVPDDGAAKATENVPRCAWQSLAPQPEGAAALLFIGAAASLVEVRNSDATVVFSMTVTGAGTLVVPSLAADEYTAEIASSPAPFPLRIEKVTP